MQQRVLVQIFIDETEREQFHRGIERRSLDLDLRVQSWEWGEESLVGLSLGQERRLDRQCKQSLKVFKQGKDKICGTVPCEGWMG